MYYGELENSQLRGIATFDLEKLHHMWVRLLAGKNGAIFFVFQESSLAMNRKNKMNV